MIGLILLYFLAIACGGTQFGFFLWSYSVLLHVDYDYDQVASDFDLINMISKICPIVYGVLTALFAICRILPGFVISAVVALAWAIRFGLGTHEFNLIQCHHVDSVLKKQKEFIAMMLVISVLAVVFSFIFLIVGIS